MTEAPCFRDVGDVHAIRNAVGGVAAGDDVLLADLLRPPAQRRHAVLDGAGREVLGEPALDQLLDVLGLQALGIHMPETHLVELIGDQVEDVFPIRLGGIAAVAVTPAELLQVVVQIAHREFPLGAAVRGVYARGASMSAICSKHRRQAAAEAPGEVVFRCSRMIHFLSKERRVGPLNRSCSIRWCSVCQVSVSARLGRQWQPQGELLSTGHHSRCARLVCCSPAPHGAFWRRDWRSPGERSIARVINPRLTERR